MVNEQSKIQEDQSGMAMRLGNAFGDKFTRPYRHRKASNMGRSHSGKWTEVTKLRICTPVLAALNKSAIGLHRDGLF